MGKIGNVCRNIHGIILKRPTNFSWVIANKLAGSGMPTSLPEINWIRRQNILSIMTMTEDALPKNWIQDLDYLHVPTPDFGAPGIDQINNAVDFIHLQINQGRPVLVHCAAGLGRAGTILGCYLVKYKGYSAEKAINEIRTKRPRSIQSVSQETAIANFAL